MSTIWTYGRRPSSIVRYRHGGYNAIYPLAQGETFHAVAEALRQERLSAEAGGDGAVVEPARGAKVPESNVLSFPGAGVAPETARRQGTRRSAGLRPAEIARLIPDNPMGLEAGAIDAEAALDADGAESLLTAGAAALDAVAGYLQHCQAVTTDRIAPGGRIDAALLDLNQRAAHGLAWIATYREALVQLQDWAGRCVEADRFGAAERAIYRLGFAEYLSQLTGGIPIGQSEIVRPVDLGVEEAADRLRIDHGRPRHDKRAGCGGPAPGSGAVSPTATRAPICWPTIPSI